jgi:sulfate permease, SulP family
MIETMLISVRPGSLAQRLLPVLSWLPGYRRDWLLPDVLAGLAVWAVMVPEGMAYAGIVGVPPIMGLYTIVPPLMRADYNITGSSNIWVRSPRNSVPWAASISSLLDQTERALVASLSA